MSVHPSPSARVLLVDDEQSLVTSLERGLGAEGFAVGVALDGHVGLDRARSEPWDVIVCDIMLPGVNGYRLCRRLRDAGIWTPMLMLTAKDGELDEAEALDEGADDWLTKPFAFVVLVARLRALLRRPVLAHASVVVAGDLTLDLAAGRCLRAGTQVPLTRRELALAELLVHHEGRVVSKREILHELWGSSFAGDPNIVEVYVARLRRKLEAAAGRTTIVTVRGLGYQLVTS